MIDLLFNVLKEINWGNLKRDTVLNVWTMRTAPEVSEHSLVCDWPLVICDAQGDSNSEEPLQDRETLNKIRMCIPSDITGISFRIKILAGGLLENKESIFHIHRYQWIESD